MNELTRASRILRFLLEKGQLTLDDDRELYMDLKDPEIRNVVAVFEEELDFGLVDAPNAFYLSPNIENTFLGFLGKDFRRWFGSDGLKADGFLLCYIVMVLLNCFYGGHNQNPKQREFMRVIALIEELDKRFEKILVRREQAEALEDQVSLNFVRIAELWSSKQMYEDRARKTKEGTVMNALSLLVEQKLIRLADDDKEIRPTKKLDDLMLYYFLGDNRIQEIHAVFQDAE